MNFLELLITTGRSDRSRIPISPGNSSTNTPTDFTRDPSNLMPKPKMTRQQAAAIASAARKLPEGVVSDRVQIQSAISASEMLRKQTPAERGATYKTGLAFEKEGYLLIYKILDRLGVRIICIIAGSPMEIVCRHKSYKGDNQRDLLLEILQDSIENFNYLGTGGFANENQDDEAG